MTATGKSQNGFKGILLNIHIDYSLNIVYHKILKAFECFVHKLLEFGNICTSIMGDGVQEGERN